MPSKRRNNGKNRYNRGNVKNTTCVNCGRQVAKDKAIKKFTVRDIVDASSKEDITARLAYAPGTVVPIPKLYYKMQYCVSCAIHNRIVAVRSRVERRKRRQLRDPRKIAAEQIKKAKKPEDAEVKAN